MKLDKTAKKRFKLSHPKNKKRAKLIHTPQGIAHLMSKRNSSRQSRDSKERAINATAKGKVKQIISGQM